MIGMSTTTGRAIGTLEHIRQSIRDILTTPIGTRVMRREYGSLLPYLVDAPMDQATVIDIIQASAGAIARWEPRVRVERIAVDTVDADGHLTLALDVRVLETGEAARLEGIAV
jgi:phage baseplate assembly protein W